MATWHKRILIPVAVLAFVSGCVVAAALLYKSLAPVRYPRASPISGTGFATAHTGTTCHGFTYASVETGDTLQIVAGWYQDQGWIGFNSRRGWRRLIRISDRLVIEHQAALFDRSGETTLLVLTTSVVLRQLPANRTWC